MKPGAPMAERLHRAHSQALIEDAAFDGRIRHTLECDLLFAEFQGYEQARTGCTPSWKDLRGCQCEEVGGRG